MYKKVYFFISNLAKEGREELDNLLYLLNANSYDEIYKRHHKVGNKKDDSTFSYGTNLEIFLLKKYLKDKNIKDFNLFYEPEFFIVNNDLYIIENSEIKKIDIDGTLFLTLRTSFSHPFFEILDILCKKKGGFINKPTFRPIDTTQLERNKFTGIVGLYKNNFKYLDNIIIPYRIKENNYETFLNWIKNNFSQKIIFKIDCRQCGWGLTTADLKENIEKNICKAKNMILKNNYSSLHRPYIVDFYEFKNEYRVYFIKDKKGNIKIYSIKTKNLTVPTEDLFSKKSFKDVVRYKWSYINKKDRKDYEHIIKASKEMIKEMIFETGTLEFGETKDGKIIFFEVNPMGSPMVFEGDDVNDIHEFYMDLFDSLILKK